MQDITTAVSAVSLPPDIVGEICQFIPSVSIFLKVRLISSTIRDYIDCEFPHCASRLTFAARDLSILSVRGGFAPYVFQLALRNAPFDHLRIGARLFDHGRGDVDVDSTLMGSANLESISSIPKMFPNVQSLSFVGYETLPFEGLVSCVSGLQTKGQLRRLHLEGFASFPVSEAMARCGNGLSGLRSLLLCGKKLRCMESFDSAAILPLCMGLEDLQLSCLKGSIFWISKTTILFESLRSVELRRSRVGVLKGAEDDEQGRRNPSFGRSVLPNLQSLTVCDCSGVVGECFEDLALSCRKLIVQRNPGLRQEGFVRALKKGIAGEMGENALLIPESRFDVYKFVERIRYGR